MIQANELRIGNVVYFDGRINTVTSIDGRGVIKFTLDSKHGVRRYQQDLDPIRLTPELLEKCGFKKWLSNRWNGVIDLIEEDGRYFLLGGDFAMGVPIEYLHDLQNLAYDLTKQELEVNL